MLSPHELAAMDQLDEEWGQEYDLMVRNGTWWAVRLADLARFRAASAGALHCLLAAEAGLVTAQPPERGGRSGR